MTKEQRKPLAYRWPSERYGRGVCGTHGMMAGKLGDVTCDRCRRSSHFIAASSVASRYEGTQP